MRDAQADTREQREPTVEAGVRFTIRRALLASIVVHLLLILGLRALPSAPSPSPEVNRDVEVRFELPRPAVDEQASELLRPGERSKDTVPDDEGNPRPSALGEPGDSQPPSDALQRPPAASVPAPTPEDVRPTDRSPDPSSSASPIDVPQQGGRPMLPDERSSSTTSPPSIRERMRDFLQRAQESPAEAEPSSPAPPSGSRRGLDLPDLDRLPTSGFGMDRNLVFESTDYDWSDYSRQIYMAIWRAWHNRLWATAERFERWSYASGNPFLQHQVAVRFTIEASGEVVGIEILLPSGCEPLDASAADALAEVVLPPLPDDFPRERENVRARFVATGEIKGMRRYLDYLKRQGWF